MKYCGNKLFIYLLIKINDIIVLINIIVLPEFSIISQFLPESNEVNVIFYCLSYAWLGKDFVQGFDMKDKGKYTHKFILFTTPQIIC